MGRILVGTSGYVYRDWKSILYEGVPQRQWLEYYAAIFPTVELNGTFYRLPKPEVVDRWRESTPDGFVFAAKGSRFLTHNKKLHDVGEGLHRYFEPIRRLGRKLGPVLWQLPPQLKKPDPERLDHFLRALPRGIRYVVEFRNAGWYTDEILDLLDARGVAVCEHDILRERPARPTGGFRYLRFHGTSSKYSGRYGRETLRRVAMDLRRWERHADAYVYFNNDRYGHALLDAFDLSDLLGEPARARAETIVEARR